MKILKFIRIFLVLTVFSQCNTIDPASPGALVPPTADQDPQLPQLKITVAHHTRTLHLQKFGNPHHQPVFVLPGGPGADFKLLLPLKALSDKYYVIMWDPRGAGLSERVTKEELSLESFNEEIDQVRSELAPNRKIILIGHSFGGILMAHYTATHPDKIKQLILIDPGKLDLSLPAKSNGGAINFMDGQDFFWQNELLTSKDHAEADYKAIEVLRQSSRNWTCNHSIIENYPLWRFGAYHYYMVQKNTYRLPKKYNWAAGIENFKGPVSIITGTCGALSESFQKKTNLITIPDADFQAIPGANHISLFTGYADKTVAAVRKALKY